MPHLKAWAAGGMLVGILAIIATCTYLARRVPIETRNKTLSVGESEDGTHFFAHPLQADGDSILYQSAFIDADGYENSALLQADCTNRQVRQVDRADVGTRIVPVRPGEWMRVSEWRKPKEGTMGEADAGASTGPTTLPEYELMSTFRQLEALGGGGEPAGITPLSEEEKQKLKEELKEAVELERRRAYQEVRTRGEKKKEYRQINPIKIFGRKEGTMREAEFEAVCPRRFQTR